MEQDKRGKRTKRILDILLLLCGTVFIVRFPWEMMGKTWMAVIPFIVLVCMAWALLDLLFSCVRRKKELRISGQGTYPGQGIQKLILLDGQGKPVKSWDLQGRMSLIIGKAGQNQELDVDLSDCEYSCFIDFQHAVLNFCLDQWYIEDLESQNGVRIKKVEDGECYRVIHRPCRVTAGDVLYIASTKLLLT